MLLEKAEKLFEAGKARQAKECIGELLDFLDEYTKEHFADEEEYMLSINYPEYSAQKPLMKILLKDLQSFVLTTIPQVEVCSSFSMPIRWLLTG